MENKEQFNLSEKIFKDPEMGVIDWAVEVKDVKQAVKILKEKLRSCDAMFDVSMYSKKKGYVTTDKFVNIVELFINEIFGCKLNG